MNDLNIIEYRIDMTDMLPRFCKSDSWVSIFWSFGHRVSSTLSGLCQSNARRMMFQCVKGLCLCVSGPNALFFGYDREFEFFDIEQ